jgi:hypothetical protein
MDAVIALAGIGVFVAGIVAGVIAVVTVAIRREERNLTLTSGPTDTMTRTGRWLNGVGVRTARRSPPMPGQAGDPHAVPGYPAGGHAPSMVPTGRGQT